MSELLPASSGRQYPQRPIVAVGVVVFKDGRVLLIQRGSKPSYGEWSIPGGAVELGETLREAAVREVVEECGIEVDLGDVVEVIDRVLRDPRGVVEYHYVLVDFAARYTGGTLRAGSDVLAAQWLALSDADRLDLAPVTKAVIHRAAAMLGLPGYR